MNIHVNEEIGYMCQLSNKNILILVAKTYLSIIFAGAGIL